MIIVLLHCSSIGVMKQKPLFSDELSDQGNVQDSHERREQLVQEKERTFQQQFQQPQQDLTQKGTVNTLILQV